MTDQLLVSRELLERLDFGKDAARALQALPELRALLAQPAASEPKPENPHKRASVLKDTNVRYADGCEPKPVEVAEAREALASQLCAKLAHDRGAPIAWAEAIEIVATITQMPAEEKTKLLAMDDSADQECAHPTTASRLQPTCEFHDDDTEACQKYGCSEPKPPKRFTCIGKGGEYNLVGSAFGAGTMKQYRCLMVYQDYHGRLFVRDHDDFWQRMQEIDPVPAGIDLADIQRYSATSQEAEPLFEDDQGDLVKLADVLDAPKCDHQWVDARNQYVTSGEICAKLCGAVRPGNEASELPFPDLSAKQEREVLAQVAGEPLKVACASCGGKGSMLNVMRRSMPCYTCNGSGKVKNPRL